MIRRVAFFLAAAAVALPSMTWAQGYCSGRCKINGTGDMVSCGLSVFGHWICDDISNPGVCIEYACPRTGALRLSLPAPEVDSCTLAAQAPGARTPGVKVLLFKARA